MIESVNGKMTETNFLMERLIASRRFFDYVVKLSSTIISKAPKFASDPVTKKDYRRS